MTPDQVAKYIGMPWVSGAWDCWAFFRHCQRQYYGIDVPVVDVDALDLRSVITTIDTHVERARWLEVRNPISGDAVLMKRNRYPSHIGLWVEIDGGKVLHCAQGMGVVCQNVMALAFDGWGSLEFYRRRQWQP